MNLRLSLGVLVAIVVTVGWLRRPASEPVTQIGGLTSSNSASARGLHPAASGRAGFGASARDSSAHRGAAEQDAVQSTDQAGGHARPSTTLEQTRVAGVERPTFPSNANPGSQFAAVKNQSDEAPFYFKADFERRDWFEDFRRYRVTSHTVGLNRCQRVYDQDARSHVLQVSYPQREVELRESGAYWRMFFPRKFERLTLSYRVKFQKGLNFVLGGKLPGVAGGGQDGDPDRPVAGGEKPTGSNGWSARVMWREDGLAELYAYHLDQPGVYGHRLGWTLGGRAGGDEVRFVPGKWHRIRLQIELNEIGKSNGRVHAWLDDSLVLDYAGFRFRTVSGLQIDSLHFSTFYGGQEPDWAPKKDELIFFDDFEIRSADVRS